LWYGRDNTLNIKKTRQGVEGDARRDRGMRGMAREMGGSRRCRGGSRREIARREKEEKGRGG
jgi:hypothetical protein